MSRVQANPLNMLSYLAGEDLSSKQYRAVVVDVGADARTVTTKASSTEGAHCVGIVQNDPSSGEAANVATAGTSRLEMAANCDSGEKIMSNANGKGKPADGDQKSIVGIALTSNTSGDGGFIEVQVLPGAVAQADESD